MKAMEKIRNDSGYHGVGSLVSKFQLVGEPGGEITVDGISPITS